MRRYLPGRDLSYMSDVLDHAFTRRRDDRAVYRRYLNYGAMLRVLVHLFGLSVAWHAPLIQPVEDPLYS